MSFSNTQTPLKPTTKAKWQVPQRRCEQGPLEYYLEGEVKEKFCKLFPKHSNQHIMQWFGISFSTMQRFKRELNLHKDMRAIRKELAKDVKAICEKNGYYESLRGKSPSPQCIEASKAWWASGNHPMKILKKRNIRKYKRLMQEKSEQRKELDRKEKFRVGLGLRQETNLHIPTTPFTRQQCSFRHNMIKQGYILGDMRERMGERYVIYYDKETNRSPVREQHAKEMGFTIKKLK